MRNHSICALPRLTSLLAAGIGLGTVLQAAEVLTSGYVKREVYYLPVLPNTIAALTDSPNFPDSPDAVTYIDSFASPQSADPNVENYGGRLSGFITPSETADYVFFVSSDDPGAFYLSTDEDPANKKLVAQENTWSDPLRWQSSGGGSSLADKRSDQFAGTQWPGGATIHLEAGKRYYAEMLWKEGTGGDNGGVTMIKASEVVTVPDDPFSSYPADDDPSTLTGALVSTLATDTLGFLKQPESQTILQSRPVTFSVIAATPPGNPPQDPTKLVPDVSYQWRKNGVDIPIEWDEFGENPLPGSSGTASYVIPSVTLADNDAKFTCVVTVVSSGQSVTSAEVTLTVTTDDVAPTIVGVTGSPTFNSATLTFDEAVDVSGATFSFTGGLTAGAVTVLDPTRVTIATSTQAEGAEYTVTVNGVKDLAGNVLTVNNTASFNGYVFKAGLVQYGTWQNQTGGFDTWENGTADDPTPVRDLPPTTRAIRTLFEANEGDEYDNYFGQLTAYFIPPTTGDYVFFMSSDDHGELWLSTDEDPANKKRIAVEPTWNDRRNWLGVDRRGGEGFQENRSDQYFETEWPSGATINLTAGNRYYIELLFKEGGGGDNGGATYKLASAADPASGTASTITGNAVGSYVDPEGLPPIITQRPVGKVFEKGENIELSVTVDSPSAVTYQWFRNKRPIPGATASTLVINNAGVADIGDYYVDVISPNGTVSSYPDNDSRLVMKGAYVIEAEDFNYDSGKTVAAASTMPLAADLFRGLDGIPDTDFRNTSQTDMNPSVNGSDYRNGWVDDGNPIDPPFDPAGGNLGIALDNGGGNTERPDFTLANNYKIGWNGSGNWWNYTRDFPEGTYNAVWVGSRDGRAEDAYGRVLELVTGDPTQPNAAATVLAELTFSGTGGWSSNDYIPFLAPGSTSLAQLTLGAGTTLRLRINVGDGDNDFLLFYPAEPVVVGPEITSVVLNPNGSITIKWTGGGQLEAAPTLNGPYTPVPDATGGEYTWTPGATDTQLFGRIRD